MIIKNNYLKTVSILLFSVVTMSMSEQDDNSGVG